MRNEAAGRAALLVGLALGVSGIAGEPMPVTKVIAPAQPPAGAPKSLKVYPQAIGLDGPRDRQHLVVLGEYPDGRTWDLTRDAKFRCEQDVAAVDASGVVRGAKDGQTHVVIEAAGVSAKVPVAIKNAASDVPVNFTREVVPVLTKFGCNQGACHGAQHGRGGFKLSLFGFDPAFDHNQIVQSAEGRRVVLSDPERSILLLKPALSMEHAGGERIKAGSPAYRLLKLWLEDGAPRPTYPELLVTKLEVYPERRAMVLGEKQQIVVRATWSDGRAEDVTALAQYDSLNDSVVSVDAGGLMTAKGQGESHVMVRYCGQANVVQATLPYAKLDKFPDFQVNNFIDAKLVAKWKELGLTPSAPCSDAEFFRRIHLDGIGALPSPGDVRAFLADPNPNKRALAIDKVLERPELVDFWTNKWGDLLRIRRDRLGDKGMWSFHNWVRASLRDGKTIDEFARDIVTAQGSTFTDGPANFFRNNDRSEWTEMTAQLFLGVRMQCAKCHHHPFEKWSQDDYYGLQAYFARVGTKNSNDFGIFGRETVVMLQPGEQNHPRRGGVVKPKPLDGAESDDPIDRRIKFAEWMTSKENPFFARNVVNRFWGYCMGRGLVEPLDDMRATNPASNPELLDALAKDFADHKFDMKHLLRTIFNSRAYQLASTSEPGNRADIFNVHFTRYSVKRLKAEQLADAVDAVTGTLVKYEGLPLGVRASQLPDPQVRSYLLDVFGRSARASVCECERSDQPNIAQALHLLNGDELNRRIADAKGRVEELFKKNTPLPTCVEEMYLVALSRPPRAEEVRSALDWIAKAPNPKEGVQDLMWALLNSREFLFVH